MDQNQLLQLMLLVKLFKMKKKKEVKVEPKSVSDSSRLPSAERYAKLYKTMTYEKQHPGADLFDDISSSMDTALMVDEITRRCAGDVLTAPFEYKGSTRPLKSHMLEFAEKHDDALLCHVFDVSKDIKNGIYEVDWNFGSRVPLFGGEVECINWISNPIGIDTVEFSLFVGELYSFMWDLVRHCRELYEAAGRDKSYICHIRYDDFKFLVIDGKAICCDLSFNVEV